MRIATWLGLLAGVCGFGAARAEAPADRVAADVVDAVGVRTIAPLGRDGRPVDRPAVPAWDAFQGRDHHPIDEETFFRVVGREDLVRRSQHRAILKKSLIAGGGVALAGGLMYSMVTALEGFAQPAAVACPSPGCAISSQSQGPSPAWGLLGIGAGLASMLVGHFLNPSPIGAAEADQLARDHDQQLKAELGMSDACARSR